MATVGDLTALCDRLWPPVWAEAWDNVGLLLGARDDPLRRCMCALDADAITISAASEAGVELLVTHHPLPFRPLRHITADDPSSAAVLLAIRRGIAVYAAHTNLDVCPGGTSRALAEALGLRLPALLQASGHETLYKLAVFVPVGHEETLLDAMASAGAGHLGKYSHCSFGARGTGTFRPLPGARPFIGEVGALERQSEVRLELLVPESRRRAAIEAMLAVHPYEEVAYDLIRLENAGPGRGYGMIGELGRSARLGTFAADVERRLGANAVRFVGPPGRTVRRVAVCGGAGIGAGCVEAAVRAGADVLVTADVRYHEAREAEARGLALVDPGHQATEAPVVAVVAEVLRAAAAEAQLNVEILVEPRRADVWRTPSRARR